MGVVDAFYESKRFIRKIRTPLTAETFEHSVSRFDVVQWFVG